MADDRKHDDKLIHEVMVDRMSPMQRRALRDVIHGLASVLQTADAQPEVAMTAMLNIMGSILGTRMSKADAETWIIQVNTMLPAYVEAYRIREKRI